VTHPLPPPVAALLLLASLAGCSPAVGTSPELGDCLQRESVAGAEVETVPTVDCSEEHDAQVVAVFDARDGGYPTDEEWEQLLVDGCLAGFEEFVGVPYEESQLELQDLTPVEEGWADGDREVICIAFLADGSVTTESFEGSGL
jgi:Septum formation